MAESLTTLLRRLLPVIALVAFPVLLMAHRLDEYLQSALVVIEPDCVRVRMNLTPGVEVAEKILKEIDGNGDAFISEKEEAAYAERFRKDLTLRLDGRELRHETRSISVPSIDELRSGWGIVQIELAAEVPSMREGMHKLSLENRHRKSLSVYLFNAARPSTPNIRIIKQNRNENQSRGDIEFTFDPSARPAEEEGFDASLPRGLLKKF